MAWCDLSKPNMHGLPVAVAVTVAIVSRHFFGARRRGVFVSKSAGNMNGTCFSLAGQTCRRRNQKGTIIFSFYISFQLYRLRFNAYCLNLKQCKLELTFSFKVSERFYLIVDYRTSCKWFEIVFFQRRRRDGKKFKLTKRNTKQGARKKGNDCNVFSFSHLILSVVLIVDSLIW